MGPASLSLLFGERSRLQLVQADAPPGFMESHKPFLRHARGARPPSLRGARTHALYVHLHAIGRQRPPQNAVYVLHGQVAPKGATCGILIPLPRLWPDRLGFLTW